MNKLPPKFVDGPEARLEISPYWANAMEAQVEALTAERDEIKGMFTDLVGLDMEHIVERDEARALLQQAREAFLITKLARGRLGVASEHALAAIDAALEPKP